MTTRQTLGLALAVAVLTIELAPCHAGPPATTSVYVWRADLGGYLDTSTNLVWGYASMGVGNYPVNYAQSSTYAANYASELAKYGYLAESAVAARYQWRMPTLMEYQNAYGKGLFWEDRTTGTGFYDQSPAAGYQTPAYGDLKWTSTLGVKKENKLVYVFSTTDGGSAAATKTSGVNAIVVRTHVP